MTVGVGVKWATAPIENLPEGAKVIRRRFRPREWGVALVRQGDRMQKYYLKITSGEHLTLMPAAALPAQVIKPRHQHQVTEGDPLNAGFVFPTPPFMGIPSEQVIIGFKPEWASAPIVNLPEGAKVVRRRFRPKMVGVAFVKQDNELREHSLALAQGDDLKLLVPSGLNRKEAARS